MQRFLRWWWRYQLLFILVIERVILRVDGWIDVMVLGGLGVATGQGFLVHGHGDWYSNWQVRLLSVG